jgi:ATP-binding cassette, subfamily B, bacterial
MGIAEWWRLINTYLRPRRRLVAALGATLVVSIGFQLVTPQLVHMYIDRAISPRTARQATTLAVLYMGAVVIQQVFRVAAAWMGEILGWLTTNELRADLMAHCLALDPQFHATHPPGELIERVDGDLEGLSLFFSQFLLNMLGSILLLIAVIVVVWVQSTLAGVVLTIFAVAGIGAITAVRRVAASAWEQARQTSAVLFGFIEERLAGTEDIRSSGGERYTLGRFYGLARDRIRKTTRARVLDRIPSTVQNLVSMTSFAVAFILPAVLVRRGTITVGAAFALYFYTQLLMQPLGNMSDQVEALQQAIAGGRRVLALLNMQPTMQDGTLETLPSGALPVRYDSLTFGYGDDPDVLHAVTIDVPAGSVLGIVGRTGSGKSSLARLVVRLHDPRQGSVIVGGTDLRELDRTYLRSRVALVTQEVHVFRATVRENMTLFDPTIGDDALLDAITGLGLGRWFGRLPDGLDTVIREGGLGMSAGEAQLLAFGRAFVRDPSVVVLDEASSRLDPATEAILEKAVTTLLQGRTGIVIAHRLASLEQCDTICVLDHGRVVEHGDREALASDPRSVFGRLLRAGLDVVA